MRRPIATTLILLLAAALWLAGCAGGKTADEKTAESAAEPTDTDPSTSGKEESAPGETPQFSDGFESGDLSEWSETVSSQEQPEEAAEQEEEKEGGN